MNLTDENYVESIQNFEDNRNTLSALKIQPLFLPKNEMKESKKNIKL